MLRSILYVAACLPLTRLATAQSINLDIGTNNPAPSAGFGAAASQPGMWNAWDPTAAPMALADLAGMPTGAMIQRTVGTGFNFYFNNATTTGNDELLLDDGDDPGASSTFTVTGLAAGSYEITCYAWAPDVPTYQTDVSVNGGPITTVGGPFTGTYQVGVTHSFDTVMLPVNGTLTIVVAQHLSPATFDGVQIKQIGGGTPIVTYCSGDGSGTACPCGNAGAAGNGCASSISTGGAHLGGAGNASISNDTFVLTGTSMPNSSALYFQGTAQTASGAGSVFGDGLRCAGGSVVRLGTKVNAAGTSSYPTGADVHIGVKGANSAGAVRDYQVWYRNAAAFCTPSTFNLSNGLETTWIP